MTSLLSTLGAGCQNTSYLLSIAGMLFSEWLFDPPDIACKSPVHCPDPRKVFLKCASHVGKTTMITIIMVGKPQSSEKKKLPKTHFAFHSHPGRRRGGLSSLICKMFTAHRQKGKERGGGELREAADSAFA